MINNPANGIGRLNRQENKKIPIAKLTNNILNAFFRRFNSFFETINSICRFFS